MRLVEPARQRPIRRFLGHFQAMPLRPNADPRKSIISQEKMKAASKRIATTPGMVLPMRRF
jgi:hypothetical protein